MLVLSSHASLVFVRAGLRPAFFFNQTAGVSDGYTDRGTYVIKKKLAEGQLSKIQEEHEITILYPYLSGAPFALC